MKQIGMIVALLFLLIGFAGAQPVKSYVIAYEGVFNQKYDLDKAYRRYHSVLIEQLGTSHFYMNPNPYETGINEVVIETDTSFRVIKHSSSGKLIFGEIDFSGKEKFYEDTLHPMQWSLSDEIRVIDSFECKNAVTWFRGRKYEAWYCPEIPIPNGPWKMGGLPGLIIEMREASGDMHFRLEFIRVAMLEDIKSNPIMQKSHPDMQAYVGYWHKLLKMMKGMAAAQSGADCLTCQTTPTIQIRRWERFSL